MRWRQLMCYPFVLCVVCFYPAISFPQDFSKVEITTENLGGNIYMFQGSGGNLAASVGKDGIFLVDDQMAPLAGKIKSALSAISKGKVRFVLNTHWHFDHVGGNEALAKAGAVLVAHKTVRKRMSAEQVDAFFNSKTPPAPEIARPVLTYVKELDFFLNDEIIEVTHPVPAHTDGDSIVFFRNANVLHAGDIYFQGMYPFIDYSTGGSIDGVIQAGQAMLAMIDDKTKVIPGHGSLSTKADFKTYIDMLNDIRHSMAKYIEEGKSLEQIQKLKPTARYDAKWGNGFLPPEKFVQMLFDGMTGNSQAS